MLLKKSAANTAEAELRQLKGGKGGISSWKEYKGNILIRKPVSFHHRSAPGWLLSPLFPELKGPSWPFSLNDLHQTYDDDQPWLTRAGGEEEELKNRERRVWKMDRSCHSVPFLLSVVWPKSLTAKPRKRKKKCSHCLWGNKKNHFVSLTIVDFFFFF